MGHFAGADIVDDLLDWSAELDIKIITLYALSAENLSRPQNEIDRLYEIISQKLSELLNEPKIDQYRVNVKGIGNLSLLPQEIQEKIHEIEQKTKDYDGLFFNLALAYGGRYEILEAVKNIATDVVDRSVEINDITNDMIENYLFTSHLSSPEPDLVIRTSGEERLSGFLLWQSAYSELVFLDVYWPDFRKIDLMRAIRTYQNRNRRYGE
jgi:tritrans,polycis-undecaprenyl-diphosphate synthase [geranylgeranyl-diphosphate specific]